MRPNNIIFLIILALLLGFYTEAYNILAIFSIPLQSHYMAVKPLLEELGKRGHSVTVLNYFPSEHYSNNFKDIHLGNLSNKSIPKREVNLNKLENGLLNNRATQNWFEHCKLVHVIVETYCNITLSNDRVKQVFKENPQFDIAIVEQFTSDCELGLASLLNIPIIGITSHVLLPWSYSRFSLPFNLGSDAYYFSGAGLTPTFGEKVEIYISNLMFNTIAKWLAQWKLRRLFSEHMGEVPNFEHVARNMRLILVSQYFPLTGSRLLTPQIVEVGGMHIGEVKPLPQDLHSIVAAAENGVIYMSFGSMIIISTIPNDKLQQILACFGELSQTVLMKWDDDKIPGAPKNVIPVRWLPQLDVLCHKNVRVFVSHGGMLGTSEAVHCGVPTLAIPFFGDQFGNAACVRDSGLGAMLKFEDITKDTLLKNIKELLKSESRERAKEVSAVWRDRPMSPLDTAVYWTEWVGRHNSKLNRTGRPYPQQRKSQTFLDSSLLDVYLFLLTVVIILICMMLVILRVVFKCLKHLICFITRKHHKTKEE